MKWTDLYDPVSDMWRRVADMLQFREYHAVTLLGIEHVERNGHHYVNGMAALPRAEQEVFRAAHPDLYERTHGAVRVVIRAGQLALGSLDCPGFASGAEPDWSSMQPLPAAAPEGVLAS